MEWAGEQDLLRWRVADAPWTLDGDLGARRIRDRACYRGGASGRHRAGHVWRAPGVQKPEQVMTLAGTIEQGKRRGAEGERGARGDAWSGGIGAAGGKDGRQRSGERKRAPAFECLH